MSDLAGSLEPGMFVECPAAPGWGLGQVQSVVGHRVTVMFEHAGKVVVDMRHARLAPVFDPGNYRREN